MNTEPPIDDLGPPLVIGAIMIAVGLALPVIALAWTAGWIWKWAAERAEKEPRERG